MKRAFEEKEADDLGERISSLCYHKFDELSSRGKPSSNEWTHLAAFVSVKENHEIDVISIGTGTKCLGGEKEERGTNGCLLHDSHAEVIARRCLLRYLYEEILHEKISILVKEEKKKFCLNKSVRLYLFVSYAPCGPAAFLSDPIKRPKFDHKAVNLSGNELYLKPGKGYQTTSLSCTNKINRWIYQGIEGSLLNQIITCPVKLSGLFIKTNIDLSTVFPNVCVKSVNNEFAYGPSSERVRPCSMSIAWWKGIEPCSSIVTVDGHLLGQVKKLKNQQKYASPIAKCSLFKLYLEIMDHLPTETMTYAQAKQISSNSLRNQFMSANPKWIKTDPEIFYSFSLQFSSKKTT